MYTQYFMIDKLLEVFILPLTRAVIVLKGQELSFVSFLPKFAFIAIYYKCLRETADLLDFIILLFCHMNILFLSV